MKSWRVTFRCNPYRAQSHFLWINAPDNITYEQIRQAAYKYKDGLPVDVIDDITKWFWTVDNPQLTLNNEQNPERSVARGDASSTSPDKQNPPNSKQNKK